MKINIVGLGWFGTPLAEALLKDGYSVSGSTRSLQKLQKLEAEKIPAFVLDPSTKLPVEQKNSDIIVLNIPPFEGQLEWFKTWDLSPETWIIFISSTSEAPLLLQEEEWVKSTFKRWTILRFGGLIGGGRHPGKHLSGRKNLPGRLWPVNLIHRNDTVAFTKLVIERNILRETINVVSSEHPTREEFYTDYCQEKNLPVPEFDSSDSSLKPPISNDHLRRYYSTFTSLKNFD